MDLPDSMGNLPSAEVASSPRRKTGWPWSGTPPEPPKKLRDGQSWPKISIVTPSYNQGTFLEKTIRSVLLQGYSNLQYIVIDGGSTDASVEVIKKYEPWIDYWESTPDRGQSHAINKGMDRADGEIVAWLNSDDFYMPNALRYVAESFEGQPPEVGAIVGIGQKVDEEGHVGHTPTLHDLSFDAFLNWMQGGSFLQPSCFMRKVAWNTIGPLREDIRYGFDVDLWLRMSKEYLFEGVDILLAQALEHKDAKTISDRREWELEVALVIAQHGGEEGLLIARDNLTGMLEGHKRFLKLINNPVYRHLVSPVYRFIKSIKS
jgi:glycosyltransferase involved in cell wall biosynthesis